MKKAFLVAGSLAVMTLAVSAQSSRKRPPAPPTPPKAPVEMAVDVPAPPPPPPGPPPPPPPPALKKRHLVSYPKDYTEFRQRNPEVRSIHWDNDAIVITRKDGKTDRYKADENGIREAEVKYGKLPAPPPPPPPPPAPPAPPKAPIPPTEEQ